LETISYPVIASNLADLTNCSPDGGIGQRINLPLKLKSLLITFISYTESKDLSKFLNSSSQKHWIITATTSFRWVSLQGGWVKELQN
jgi:hypothetical protein